MSDILEKLVPARSMQDGRDWKSIVVAWLVSQSVPTVLLCAILGFMGYAVIVLIPLHIAAINDGYNRNSEALDRSVDKIVASQEKDRQLWITLIEKMEGIRIEQCP